MTSPSSNIHAPFNQFMPATGDRAPLPTPRGGAAFTDYLQRQITPTGSPAEQAHAKAREAAQGLVANALILPVLKQVRHASFGQNTIFSPGIGEKTFGPEFDMQIADRIAHSPRMTLTASLANRLESRGQTQAPESPSKASEQNQVVSPGVDVHG